MNKKVIVLIMGLLIALVIGGGLMFFSRSADKEKEVPNEQVDRNENNSNKEDSSNNNSTSNPSDKDNISDKKIAIVYFSATGTTKSVAEYIKNATKGDLIEIVPAEKYTSSDLNYGNNNSRANKEQNNFSARPKISNDIDVSDYDTIYLGYPIWWGDVPKIILTFLDIHDLSGKTVIPFSTSHSSGISGSLSTLKSYNKNINWVDGKRFDGNTNESEINNWIESLNN